MEGIVGRFFEAFAVVVTRRRAGLAVRLAHADAHAVLALPAPAFGRGHGRVRRSAAPSTRWSAIPARGRLDAARTAGASCWPRGSRWLSSAVLLRTDRQGLLPREDEGHFSVTCAGAARHLDRVRRWTGWRAVEEVLKRQPGIEAYFSPIGAGGRRGRSTKPVIVVHLRHWSERDASQQQIIERVDAEFAAWPASRHSRRRPRCSAACVASRCTSCWSVPSSTRWRDRPRVARAAAAGARSRPARPRPATGAAPARARVDRDRGRGAGLSGGDVALAVSVLAGGLDMAKYNDVPGDGERYDVRLKAAEADTGARRGPLGSACAPPRGEMLRLDSVASRAASWARR